MGQTLYPTAIVAKGGLGGLVTDIDDDPASPDGNWCTSGSASTYSGSGNGTVAALTGSGAGPMTGTTYWLHDPANGTTVTTPSGTVSTLGSTSLTSSGGRACYKTPISDSQSNSHLEWNGGFINIGTPFGRSLFFRFWLKFDANYNTRTNGGEGKWKIARLGRTATNTTNATFYYWPGQWEIEEFGDGFDSYYLRLSNNNDPESDTTLLNWNEFIFELVYPPNSGSMSSSYFKMYRNGSLLGTSNTRQWFTSTSDHISMWGGCMTMMYPQLNSAGTGGGDIYVGETSITDYFYSTY